MGPMLSLPPIMTFARKVEALHPGVGGVGGPGGGGGGGGGGLGGEGDGAGSLKNKVTPEMPNSDSASVVPTVRWSIFPPVVTGSTVRETQELTFDRVVPA